MVLTLSWNATAPARSALMKSSPVHKIKAIQGSTGAAPADAGRSRPKGFTSLSMNGLGNMNPAERRPNYSSQTLATESLGWASGWPSPCCSLLALRGFATLPLGPEPPPQPQNVAVALQPGPPFFCCSQHCARSTGQEENPGWSHSPLLTRL